MSDLSKEPPRPPSDGLDVASRLEHITDDTEARGACRDWVLRELGNGRDPDELPSELAAGGWPEDDAAQLVEEGRRKTRHLRGVLTREDVARAAESRYRRSMSRSPLLVCFGIIGVAIHSCRTLLGYFIIRNPGQTESPKPPRPDK